MMLSIWNWLELVAVCMLGFVFVGGYGLNASSYFTFQLVWQFFWKDKQNTLIIFFMLFLKFRSWYQPYWKINLNLNLTTKKNKQTQMSCALLKPWREKMIQFRNYTVEMSAWQKIKKNQAWDHKKNVQTEWITDRKQCGFHQIETKTSLSY